MKPFADRLAHAIESKNNCVCVGIDPVLPRLPGSLQPPADDPAVIAGSFAAFGKAIVDVVAPLVPVVKPQAAFFEQYGAYGFEAMGEVVRYARSQGLLVVMDAKRGDIGNTAAAYADSFLNPEGMSGLCSDALTVNPYMGDDALQPFVDVARDHGNGLFVLVKTSNPGGRQFQDLSAGDHTVYQHVASHVQQLSAESIGECGYGSIGAVVGATYPEQLAELREQMPNTIFLIPGFGAQGGKAGDLNGAFDSQGQGAIVNSSRNIIFAQARPEFAAESDWQRAVELATKEMIDQLAEVV